MQPVARFISAIKLFCPALTAKEIEYLANVVFVQELKSKQYYLQSGALQSNIGFVCSGLLRGFYVDGNGKEITVQFVQEDQYAVDCAALIRQKPSSYNFQCKEDTIVVNIPVEHIQYAYRNFPMIERFGRLIAQEIVAITQIRIESFQCSNAEDRYLNFITNHPDLFRRVSLTDLSSYLGIERPSLSRIRRKFKEKSIL